jgi:hypothetical protein
MSRRSVSALRPSQTCRLFAPVVVAAVLVAVLLGQSATSVVRPAQIPGGTSALSSTGAELGLVPAAPRGAVGKPDGEGAGDAALPWIALVAAVFLLLPAITGRIVQPGLADVRLQTATRWAAARAPPVAPGR